MARGHSTVPKLTQAAHDAIVSAVADGNTRIDAAGAAGISPRTLHAWLKKGRDNKRNGYYALYAAVKKAEAEAAAKAVKAIRAAGEKAWQAYAWWLERKYPEAWGDSRKELKEYRELIKELLKYVPGGALPDKKKPADAGAPEDG